MIHDNVNINARSVYLDSDTHFCLKGSAGKPLYKGTKDRDRSLARTDAHMRGARKPLEIFTPSRDISRLRRTSRVTAQQAALSSYSRNHADRTVPQRLPKHRRTILPISLPGSTPVFDTWRNAQPCQPARLVGLTPGLPPREHTAQAPLTIRRPQQSLRACVPNAADVILRVG